LFADPTGLGGHTLRGEESTVYRVDRNQGGNRVDRWVHCLPPVDRSLPGRPLRMRHRRLPAVDRNPPLSTVIFSFIEPHTHAARPLSRTEPRSRYTRSTASLSIAAGDAADRRSLRAFGRYVECSLAMRFEGLSPSPTPDRFPRPTRQGAGGLKSRPEPGAHAWRGPVVWWCRPSLTGRHACAAKARRMCPPACHRHSSGGGRWQ